MMQVRSKVAVNGKQVAALVKAAMAAGEMEVAALMAVARQFLLRVPSEGFQLSDRARIPMCPWRVIGLVLR